MSPSAPSNSDSEGSARQEVEGYANMPIFRSREQDARILAVLGDGAEGLDVFAGVDRFFEHLSKTLRLPCEVTGIEDFQWEEFFLFGPGSRKDYAVLKHTQPSFRDTYQLLDIQKGVDSEWMLYPLEDLTAHVCRASDKKEFYLGLSELKAVDELSANCQLLDDYSVWFANCR